METTTEEIKIVCPHCGQHLAIDPSMHGSEVECPTCKQSFTVPEAGAEEDPHGAEKDILESEFPETPVAPSGDASDAPAGDSFPASAVSEERNDAPSASKTKRFESFLHAAWNNALRPAGCFVLASFWFLSRSLFRLIVKGGRLLARVVSAPLKKLFSRVAASECLERHSKTVLAATAVRRWIHACFDRLVTRPSSWFVKNVAKPVDARWRRCENKRNGRSEVDGTQEPELSFGRRIAYVATAAGVLAVAMVFCSNGLESRFGEEWNPRSFSTVSQTSGRHAVSRGRFPSPTESEKAAMGRVFYVYAKQEILMSQLASVGQSDGEVAAAQFLAGLGGAGILAEVDTEGCPNDFADAWKAFVANVSVLKIMESGHNFMVAAVRNARQNGQYVDWETRQKISEMERQLPETRRKCEEAMKDFAAVCQEYGLENLQRWSMEAYRKHEGNPDSKLFKSDR